MKKVNLAIIGLFMLFSLPMMIALGYGTSSAGQIVDVEGNLTSVLRFNMTTVQMTANPGAGENISYYTEVMVTMNGTYFNLSTFTIQLPDNMSTQNIASLKFSNASVWNANKSGVNKTATTFTSANFNTANFSGLYGYCNGTVVTNLGCTNLSTFTIYWIMSAPITSTKITSTRAGRIWTETWNITSAASNVTISNASLLVIPSYWYSKIGDPSSVTFNGTALTGYISNYSSIEPFTDLNLSSNGNLLVYGSGYQTLSIAYNGPSIDSSSGSSPSATISVIPTTAKEIGLWLLFGLGFVVVVGGVITLVLVLRNR